MMKIIYPVAGAIALLTIATFWLSTALSELFASEVTVAAVKAAIPWGLLLLVPILAAAGGSGFVLAKGRQAGLIGAKLKRMPLIAVNGILVLIPSALCLASRASAAEFDTSFYAVQALELISGAAHICFSQSSRDQAALRRSQPFILRPSRPSGGRFRNARLTIPLSDDNPEPTQHATRPQHAVLARPLLQ